MRIFIIPFLSLFILLPCVNTQARIIHVPSDSSTIQAGINGAVDGDTVLVARGHYYERINFLGKAILVASNFIFDLDTTTIDSTIIDADTLVLGVSDQGSVVTFAAREGLTSVIEGFTIKNGIGTVGGMFTNRRGGGIICMNYSSPTIINNLITHNSANWGGGIHCYRYSSPFIANCTIAGNSGWEAGGISCDDNASPTINNNIIAGNTAGAGGGIECYRYSLAIITGNTIAGNFASVFGGGIYCFQEGGFIIRNNIITHNYAGYYGGGIECNISYPSIINNTIAYNTAHSVGSGISLHTLPLLTIRNNIISNNVCETYGGGISCWSGDLPSIFYNDVWNNIGGNFYNCSEILGDTTWGTNFNGMPCDSFYNIISAPLFADTITFKLLCNSPCVDGGDPTSSVPIDSGGCRIDMGAREYPYILGDANSDSSINVVDVVFVINYVYIDGPSPCPYHAADANCDGLADIEDVICLIKYLFLRGPLPCGF